MLYASAQLIIIKVQKYLLKWNFYIILICPVDKGGGVVWGGGDEM